MGRKTTNAALNSGYLNFFAAVFMPTKEGLNKCNNKHALVGITEFFLEVPTKKLGILPSES